MAFIVKQKHSNRLNSAEEKEVTNYIKIYMDNGFTEHFEVNTFISQNNMWDLFPNMRSLNDHAENKEIPGILPKFYAIVCKRLDIEGAGGASLDKAEHY